MVIPFKHHVGSAPEIRDFVFEEPTCEGEYALDWWEEVVWEGWGEKGEE